MYLKEIEYNISATLHQLLIPFELLKSPGILEDHNCDVVMYILSECNAVICC